VAAGGGVPRPIVADRGGVHLRTDVRAREGAGRVCLLLPIDRAHPRRGTSRGEGVPVVASTGTDAFRTAAIAGLVVTVVDLFVL
jgi:hypothetical protein